MILCGVNVNGYPTPARTELNGLQIRNIEFRPDGYTIFY